MASKICPERVNHTFDVTFLFLLKIRFLSHNFGSTYTNQRLSKHGF